MCNYPLIIIDDLSFTGGMAGRRFNSLNRYAMNARKIAISLIVTTQYYFNVLPSIRENSSFFVKKEKNLGCEFLISAGSPHISILLG